MAGTQTKKRNVYDFDKTVFAVDSTALFTWYCLKKYPRILPAILRTAVAFVLYGVKLQTKMYAKGMLYRFLGELPDTAAAVQDFWAAHGDKIQPWYLERKEPTDIIISASPEFLLRPMADKLGVALIASAVDPDCGAIQSENCWGEEKVRRLQAEYPGTIIGKFYSDSLSDSPLALLAEEAFLVKGTQLLPWPMQ
ncbi:MAG: haloacid dehalogenase-like hydrolase [Oscillospiraceae bacterium]|jgi:phosphoserine phosphatase|nr:haloacid dehalogenase-like hydrolase [Oscillospiraceae bacterium]